MRGWPGAPGQYGPAMNFGVNLPGPFRIGVSSKGRVTGGMSLGPFSVSGQLGGGKQPAAPPAIPGTLEEAIATAEESGCRVTARSTHAVTVQRGWWAWHIQESRQGVHVQPVFSTRQTLTALLVASVVFTAICMWSTYSR